MLDALYVCMDVWIEGYLYISIYILVCVNTN